MKKNTRRCEFFKRLTRDLRPRMAVSGNGAKLGASCWCSGWVLMRHRFGNACERVRACGSTAGWERVRAVGRVRVCGSMAERERGRAGACLRACGLAGERFAGLRVCGQWRSLDTKSSCGLKAQAQERRYTHGTFAFYHLHNFLFACMGNSPLMQRSKNLICRFYIAR